MSDDLRRALADLSQRERDALIANVKAAGDKWEPLLPRLGAVWSAFGAVAEDVDRLDRARRAAGR